MPQPDYVPLRPADRVRPAERLPVPDGWTPDRPADLATPVQPVGARLGRPGPDQGYGLKLARHVAQRIVLDPGEHREDAVMGALAVALKRASQFGRAPVVGDFELAFRLWGFFAGAPEDLVAHRRPRFAMAAHHYEDQRAIADAVPVRTLRMTPEDVASQLGSWRGLLMVGPTG